MGESVVKLRERRSFPSITTVGNQAISTPIAEGESLRPPAAPYRPEGEIEFLATSASIRINDPNSARPGSHDPEKRLFERHSHPSHNVPYNNSRVTYTDPENDGDDDGPKQHSIWILVGFPTPDKDFRPANIYGTDRSTSHACRLFLYYQ